MKLRIVTDDYNWRDLVIEERDVPPTPAGFAQLVSEIVAFHGTDAESSHSDLDELMEAVLVCHGYADGVEAIRETTRWYA